MKASKHVQRVRRQHSRRRGAADLNLLPMIDMMVILVFFLIFTAVFSRTSILELNLPAGDASVPELPQGLQLEVIVREGVIEVADRRTGIMKNLPSAAGVYDLQGLSEYLKAVKAKFPDKDDATILLAPVIPYDVLVQVMDTVRIYDVPGSSGWARVELFPQIAVGDAPT
ncbi:MAG: biopolymer transporter ExbD [Gammaproteobacteria bacterium]|nr:MAG: biopolymer transporter ExbD [Gammaproteobacteria bacterium]